MFYCKKENLACWSLFIDLVLATGFLLHGIRLPQAWPWVMKTSPHRSAQAQAENQPEGNPWIPANLPGFPSHIIPNPVSGGNLVTFQDTDWFVYIVHKTTKNPLRFEILVLVLIKMWFGYISKTISKNILSFLNCTGWNYFFYQLCQTGKCRF